VWQEYLGLEPLSRAVKLSLGVCGAAFVAAGALGLVPRLGPFRAVAFGLSSSLSLKRRWRWRRRAMTDRAMDMRALRGCMADAKAGEYVVVDGPPGTGKSRLVDSYTRTQFGVLEVAAPPGATAAALEEAALRRLTHVRAPWLSPRPSAVRVVNWFRLLTFGSCPTLVLRAHARPPGAPYAEVAAAAARLSRMELDVIVDSKQGALAPATRGGWAVVSDAAAATATKTGTDTGPPPLSLPPPVSLPRAELVVNVEPVPLEVLLGVPGYGRLLWKLAEADVGHVAWATLGGSFAAYDDLLRRLNAVAATREWYRSMRTSEDSDKVKIPGYALSLLTPKDVWETLYAFVDKRLQAAIRMRDAALAACPALAATLARVLDGNQSINAEDEHIILSQPDEVLSVLRIIFRLRRDRQPKRLLVPKDATIGFVLTHKLAAVPPLADLIAMCPPLNQDIPQPEPVAAEDTGWPFTLVN
jgi:hypothetical protein